MLKITLQWPIKIIKESWKDEAIEWTKSGHGLQAIKTIKNGTGWGLKESKEYWDKYIRKYYIPNN